MAQAAALLPARALVITASDDHTFALWYAQGGGRAAPIWLWSIANLTQFCLVSGPDTQPGAGPCTGRATVMSRPSICQRWRWRRAAGALCFWPTGTIRCWRRLPGSSVAIFYMLDARSLVSFAKGHVRCYNRSRKCLVFWRRSCTSILNLTVCGCDAQAHPLGVAALTSYGVNQSLANMIRRYDMQCYKHPDVEAVGACTTCGKPVCEACAIDVGGKIQVSRLPGRWDRLAPQPQAQRSDGAGQRSQHERFSIELVRRVLRIPWPRLHPMWGAHRKA